MVTLEEAKVHVRVIGPDFDDELTAQIEAARSHLESIDVDLSANPLPPALHHAILMLVGHFFENREATSEDGLRFTPIGVDRLIAPFKGVSL